MKIKYNLCQRLMAHILLASLLLQSCHNTNIPIGPIQPVEEKTTNLSIEPPQQPNNQLAERADVSEPMVDLAANKFVEEGPAAQSKQAQESNVPRIAYPKTLAQSSYQTTPLSEQIFQGRKPGSLGAQKRLRASQAVAKAKNRKDTSAQIIRQQKGKLAGRRKAMTAVAPNKEAWSKGYTAKGGHQVKFQELVSGVWQAVVKENLPAGISRSLILPVCLEQGYHITTLSEYSPVWQKSHIHIIQHPEKSCVFVGKMGLLGGMVQDEGEDEEREWKPTLDKNGSTEQGIYKIENTIDTKDLDYNEIIGEGNFGKVYKGTLNKENTRIPVAVKSLRFLTNTDNNSDETLSDEMAKKKAEETAKEIANLSKEIAVMKDLEHKNIIKLFGVCDNMIVTKLMTKGSLENYLKKTSKQILAPLNILDMAVDTAKGMRYLHKRNIVHRDLAARNLLLTDDEYGNNIIKVSDFGLSRQVNDDDYYNITSSNPIKWSAPETFPEPIGEKHASIRSDVWSYGVVLYELFNFCKIAPYSIFSNKDVKIKLSNREEMYDYLKIPDCPEGIQQLLNDCLNYNSHKRPVFKDILDTLENIKKEIEQENKWKITNNVFSGGVTDVGYVEDSGDTDDVFSGGITDTGYIEVSRDTYDVFSGGITDTGYVEDQPKDIEFYEEAALKGDVDAQNKLGFMYENGEGVEQDDKKAREWYEKAAILGDVSAQITLGLMYEEGKGGEQNNEKAIKWYKKAAMQGSEDAQAILDIMYEEGKGGE